MKEGLLSVVNFGLTSGIITTLGLMVGLHTGTHSVTVVIAGIITIAIADGLSDSLGIHVAKESENRYGAVHLWQLTLITFLAKFFMAISFLVPVMLLEPQAAIVVSIIWGLGVLALLSHAIARRQGTASLPVIGEHLLVALVVIALSYLVGNWVGLHFGSA